MRRLFLALFSVALLAEAQTARDAAWRQDLDAIATNLPKLHPNLFYYSPRPVFDTAVAKLRDDIPTLADSNVMIRMAEIVALAHDGHTNIMLSQRISNFRLLPLEFRWFTDGLFVTGVSEAYAKAAGSKVVRIGDRTAEEAHEIVKRIVSHENDPWAREIGATYLANADVLRALGIASSEPVRLELENASGTFTVEVTPLPAGQATGVLPSPDPAVGYQPLWQKNRNLNYWFTYIESSRTLVFVYNQCQEMAAQSFAAFNAQLWAAFDANPVERLIVDLRNNTGGSTSVIAPFWAAAEARGARMAQMKGGVIVGRRTFSSGMLAAMNFKSEAGAVLYGEAAGGSPSGYGEVLYLTLPYSRLLVSYSTKYFSYPAFPAGSLMPDVAVPFYSSDYFARHDPFLAAAMAEAGPAAMAEAGPAAEGGTLAVNAATFRGPVSPGGLAAAFGEFDSDRVEVNGVSATVVAATKGQVNFVVPAETRAGLATVRIGNVEGTARVVESAPGLFGATAHGGTIEVYGTGAAGESRVYVGGELAQLVDSGPGPVAGAWRWSVTVPAGATGEVPVYVSAGAAASNGVRVQVGN
jgi:hypothetical protein